MKDFCLGHPPSLTLNDRDLSPPPSSAVPIPNTILTNSTPLLWPVLNATTQSVNGIPSLSLAYFLPHQVLYLQTLESIANRGKDNPPTDDRLPGSRPPCVDYKLSSRLNLSSLGLPDRLRLAGGYSMDDRLFAGPVDSRMLRC